ncbi:MAG: hypothetical protein H6679_02340 [Epsilonproteobacteria bacterium]|nr:hypothetical protein [Campylobacterota bacterium]
MNIARHIVIHTGLLSASLFGLCATTGTSNKVATPHSTAPYYDTPQAAQIRQAYETWNANLQQAIQGNSYTMISVALQQGADPNLIPIETLTNFILVMHHQETHVNAIKSIFHSFNFTSIDCSKKAFKKWCNKILHCLVTTSWYQQEIVQLLHMGARPQSRDERGNTPLHKAYDRNIAEILVLYGADIFARNNQDHSPHQYARLYRLARCNQEESRQTLINLKTFLRAKERERINK